MLEFKTLVRLEDTDYCNAVGYLSSLYFDFEQGGMPYYDRYMSAVRLLMLLYDISEDTIRFDIDCWRRHDY